MCPSKTKRSGAICLLVKAHKRSAKGKRCHSVVRHNPDHKSPKHTEPRRSNRIRRKPARYRD